MGSKVRLLPQRESIVRRRGADSVAVPRRSVLVKNGHKPRRSRSSGPLLGLLALAATLFVVA